MCNIYQVFTYDLGFYFTKLHCTAIISVLFLFSFNEMFVFYQCDKWLDKMLRKFHNKFCPALAVISYCILLYPFTWLYLTLLKMISWYARKKFLFYSFYSAFGFMLLSLALVLVFQLMCLYQWSFFFVWLTQKTHLIPRMNGFAYKNIITKKDNWQLPAIQKLYFTE